MNKIKKDWMSILFASGAALAGVAAITTLTVLHIKEGNDSQQTIPGQPPTGPVDPVDPVDPPTTLPPGVPDYVKDAYVKIKNFDYSDPNNDGEIGFLPINPMEATAEQIENFKAKEWVDASHVSLFSIANLQNSLHDKWKTEALEPTNHIQNGEQTYLWTADELLDGTVLLETDPQQDFFIWRGLLHIDDFLNAYKWFAHTEEAFIAFMQPSLWDDIRNLEYQNRPGDHVEWNNLTHGIHRYRPGDPDWENQGNYFDDEGNFIQGTNKVNGYELVMAQRNVDFTIHFSVMGKDGLASAKSGPRFIYDEGEMSDTNWNIEDHSDQQNWFSDKSTNIMGRLGSDDENEAIMRAYNNSGANYALNTFMHETQHSIGYPHNGDLVDAIENPNAENLDAIDIYAWFNKAWAVNGGFQQSDWNFLNNPNRNKEDWFNDFNAENGTNFWWGPSNGTRPTYQETDTIQVKKESYLNDVNGSAAGFDKSWGVTGFDLARIGAIPKASDMAGQWERGEFENLPFFTWTARTLNDRPIYMHDWNYDTLLSGYSTHLDDHYGHEFCAH